MSDHILSPDELLHMRLADELKKLPPLTPMEVGKLVEKLKIQMREEALARRTAQREVLVGDLIEIEAGIERLRDEHAQLLTALAELDAKQP